MADETKAEDTGAADASATSSVADAADVAGGEDSLRAEMRSIAKQRDELKAMVRDAEKRAKAAADAEAKRQREAGDWESVAKKYEAELAEYRPQLERLSQLEERETARLESVRSEVDKMRSKVPKAIREAMPEGLDPDAELRMVRALLDEGAKRSPVADPAAPATTGRTRDPYNLPPDEARKVAREMPLDELQAIRRARMGYRT